MIKIPLLKKTNAKKLSAKEILLAKMNLKNKEQEEKYWISSGSDNLNLALSGDINNGYCRGRIVNIVGSEATGKSLLVCEAINVVWYEHHLLKNKKVKMIYDENESAFDFDLAENFGMPLDNIEWEESGTVERFKMNIWKHIKNAEDCDILLYIVDSLDSLSDEKELESQKKEMRTLEKRDAKEKGETLDKEDGDDEKLKGDYGAKKAKELSKFFRTTARQLKKTNCILLIVSQVRDDLRAKYGTKAIRTGGKGLDFYASQIIWLDETKLLTSPTHKIPYGANIEAYVRKNKLFSPRRKANFNLIYAYGIENFGSLIDFCINNNAIKKSGAWIEWEEKKYQKADLIKFFDKNNNEYMKLKNLAQKVWNEIEEDVKIDLKPKWKMVEETITTKKFKLK
jgi:recombination protein RecA